MSVTPLSRRLFIETMNERSDGAWEERPLRVLSRLSAEDRGWTGFNAVLVECEGGASVPVVLARHNVTMLAGPALRTRVSCDGRREWRDQRPGNFDVLPAQSAISWVDCGRSVFISAGLESTLVRETAFNMGLDPKQLSFERSFTCRDPQIEYLLWALKAELELDRPRGRLYADSLGVALAAQLLRRWSSAEPKPVSTGLPERRLKRVLAYIDDRLGFDLTLAEIAGVAALSPSRFGALFKQAIGIPVHQYVVRRRVKRAVELLTCTQLPLCDVALQAGFANQSHMALSVRRLTGATPKHLRDAS